MAETALQNTLHEWLSERTAASHIKASVQFLQRDRVSRLHGIPFYRMGRHVRYLKSDLDHWLMSNRVGGQADA